MSSPEITPRASGVRKRILLLTPAFPPSAGGIERTAAELAGGLEEYEVEVVAGRPPSAIGMRPPAGIKVHWAANDPPYGRRATVALTRLAVRIGVQFQPDLVLALHTRTMPAARAVARLRGARVVLVIHAREVPGQPTLARAAVRWADAVVTVSEFSQSLALSAGADPARVHIIHPGVTLPADPPKPLASRPGPPTIVTVARMSDAHKGHDVALAAMERLRVHCPDAEWTMIGDGSLRAELQRETARRGLERCVHFPGTTDDEQLGRMLNAAHVFCLLSREPPGGAAGEGFGIVFVEAGAHGLPVLAGRIPGVVDAVHDGVTGQLVDSTNPDEAAAALRELLRDRDRAQRLADGGRRWAGELSWPAVVDRYRSLIDSVLSAPARATSSPHPGWVRDLALGPLSGT
jgi:phosphatidylinositol alpha-1,6-mannosyltransferase